MKKVKRIKWENILKLIAMGICLGIVLSDFGKVFISIFQDKSLGFSWFGMFIDIALLTIFGIFLESLIGEYNDK